MKYLTEQNLGHKLEVLFPGEKVEHNRVTFVCDRHGKKIRFRPDFVLWERRMVVEFDGPVHYTRHATVLRDMFADIALKKAGWTVVHIPYFFQLTDRMVDHLFGECAHAQDLSEGFPHGFIESGVVRPHDFCLSGLGRYAVQLSDLLADGMEDEYREVRSTELGVDTFKHLGAEDAAAATWETFGHSLDMAQTFYGALRDSLCTCIEVVDVKRRVR